MHCHIVGINHTGLPIAEGMSRHEEACKPKHQRLVIPGQTFRPAYIKQHSPIKDTEQSGRKPDIEGFNRLKLERARARNGIMASPQGNEALLSETE